MTNRPFIFETPLKDTTHSPNPDDAELLFTKLYTELRAIAAVQLETLPQGQTLRPTEVVHEAYSRMKGNSAWESEKHFLNTAGVAMRQLLVDRARRRTALKRGGDMSKVPIDTIEDRIVIQESDERVLAVHDALDSLAKVDSRAAKLVELTFFLGLSHTKAADTLGVSERTARRDLVYAKAYLAEALEDI